MWETDLRFTKQGFSPGWFYRESINLIVVLAVALGLNIFFHIMWFTFIVILNNLVQNISTLRSSQLSDHRCALSGHRRALRSCPYTIRSSQCTLRSSPLSERLPSQIAPLLDRLYSQTVSTLRLSPLSDRPYSLTVSTLRSSPLSHRLHSQTLSTLRLSPLSDPLHSQTVSTLSPSPLSDHLHSQTISTLRPSPLPDHLHSQTVSTLRPSPLSDRLHSQIVSTHGYIISTLTPHTMFSGSLPSCPPHINCWKAECQHLYMERNKTGPRG